jgi:hypothetical protein
MDKSRLLMRIAGLPRRLVELNRSLQFLASMRQLGWHASIQRGASVDVTGSPLPWYTYACIEWLERRLRPSDIAFEFGTGFSTLWYSGRVDRVVAVDHDPDWFARLEPVIPGNVDLRLCSSQGDEVGSMDSGLEASEYLAAIGEFPAEWFDIVVVDGQERIACAAAALNHLKPDGLLVLDNSDRPAYRAAIEHLHGNGLGRIDFYAVLEQATDGGGQVGRVARLADQAGSSGQQFG